MGSAGFSPFLPVELPTPPLANLPISSPVMSRHDCLMAFPAAQASLGLFLLRAEEVCPSFKYSFPDQKQA